MRGGGVGRGARCQESSKWLAGLRRLLESIFIGLDHDEQHQAGEVMMKRLVLDVIADDSTR